MKTALINGSPRAHSVSGFVLDRIKSESGGGNSFVEYRLSGDKLTESDVEQIASCDSVVIAAPLYVDALPSHVVEAMLFIEENIKKYGTSAVLYAVMNCGFAESVNNSAALDMISNWGVRCGFRRGRFLGIGSGERLLVEKGASAGKKFSLWSIVGSIAVKVFSFDSPFKLIQSKNSFETVIGEIAEDIASLRSGDTVFIRPFFPKTILLNNLMTNASFFVKLKTNGLGFGDMGRKDL